MDYQVYKILTKHKFIVAVQGCLSYQSVMQITISTTKLNYDLAD